MASAGDLYIADSGISYRVGHKLGEGVTAEVFEATTTNEEVVVLKIVRPDLSPRLKQNFWREQEILTALAQAEIRTGDGKRGVPELKGFAKDRSPQFLVLEYVDGTPLDELLMQQPELRLPERAALQIADQMLRVLHLLHTDARLRRTYTDFQLQNIRVTLANDSLATFKVIDWNHVSHREEGDLLPDDFGGTDLVRLATYLYRLVTGKLASDQGEEENELRERAGDQWQHVTHELRAILTKALHPTDIYRYRTAAEFRHTIQSLLKQWQGWDSDNWTDLIYQVRQALQTPTPNDPVWRFRLLNQLDIAEQLGAKREVLQPYRQQLTAGVEIVLMAWEIGRVFFETGQYRAAIERWREVAESYQQVGMWRHIAIAEGAVELGEQNFEVVRTALEQARLGIETQDYSSAETALDHVRTTGFVPHVVTYFAYELEIHNGINSVRARTTIHTHTTISDDVIAALTKAHAVYLIAAQALAQLPSAYATTLMRTYQYPDFTREVALLSAKLEQGRQLEEDLARVKVAFTNASESDDADALETLETFLKKNRDSVEILRFCWREAARLAEKEGENYNPSLALTILELALGVGNPSGSLLDGLRQTWQAVWVAVRAEELEARFKQEREAKEQVHQIALDQLTQAHQMKLQELQQTHQQVAEAMAIQYQQERQVITDNHQRDVATEEATHQTALQQKKILHEQMLASERAAYDAELKEEKRKLKAAKEKELAEIEPNYNKQIDLLKKHGEEELRKARTEIAAEWVILNTEKSSLAQSRLDLKRDQAKLASDRNTYDVEASKHQNDMLQRERNAAMPSHNSSRTQSTNPVEGTAIDRSGTANLEHDSNNDPPKTKFRQGQSTPIAGTDKGTMYNEVLSFIGKLTLKDIDNAKIVAIKIKDREKIQKVEEMVNHVLQRGILVLDGDEQLYVKINYRVEYFHFYEPKLDETINESVKILKAQPAKLPWQPEYAFSVIQIMEEARHNLQESQRNNNFVSKEQIVSAYAYSKLACLLLNFLCRKIFDRDLPKGVDIVKFHNEVKTICREKFDLPYS